MILITRGVNNMLVQCVICDQQSLIDDHSKVAKKLRNRPIHTYMCVSCHDRIEKNTRDRHASGQFHLYSYDTKQDDF